ncbi:MAG: hypothetical protein GWN00_11300, partial [Aliifodinibius sp.]|nr:hypothetical protein [Fodinibius sp.]NIW47487.1 hypothetical protein [Gammaproteobacteria bacterium]NIX58386.1 hypothetical protein [candidate division Zixibacteria bacterium]NIY25369.1 hypothetical protein [Fodinibius sp.]
GWNVPSWPRFSFFPSGEPWDTIWVVQDHETVDIPYWPGYKGVSDQDYVCRYNDYNVTNLTAHTPMYLDVIQTSYTWSSPPLDEMIIYNFYIIPTRENIEQTYIGYWLDGNVGYCEACRSDFAFGTDDVSHYYPDEHFGVAIDQGGGSDGRAISPIGVKIFPPEEIPEDSLEWTFNWYPGGGVPSRDGLRYQDMAAGTIMQNQQAPLNGSQFVITFGPLNLTVGDTLHFIVAQVLGEGMLEQGVLRENIARQEEFQINGIFDNMELATLGVENDFKFPSPPPAPPLRVDIRSSEVTLEWEPGPGDVNPEAYQDSFRVDGAEQPFEGYRVYKSTQSATGPWTLLAQFDVEGNDWESNTGLERNFNDSGLLDYFEYFYTVTAFSKPDTAFPGVWPSQESSKNATSRKIVPGPAPQQEIGEVAVVPNPYRGDIAYHKFDPPWEKPDPTRNIWLEQDRRVLFINLPERSVIRVYTLAGDLVATLEHNDPVQGYEPWNLTSDLGQAISSGLYLFTVENQETGEVQTGKFVVIK